ncbi:MAG: hypothetical protein JWO83_3517 [Caulobacteraceae bacterium]|nr:hypothetical protein [Caulobacteraceae bacterium]
MLNCTVGPAGRLVDAPSPDRTRPASTSTRPRWRWRPSFSFPSGPTKGFRRSGGGSVFPFATRRPTARAGRSPRRIRRTSVRPTSRDDVPASHAFHAEPKSSASSRPSISRITWAETFTFRLEPALKAALTRSAEEERVHPGELLRELVRAHLAARERRAFEGEARRQSLAIGARAGQPDGDDVLRASDERGMARDPIGVSKDKI